MEELRERVGAVTVEARAYSRGGRDLVRHRAAWLRSEPVAAQLRRLNRAQRTELARLLPELAGPGARPEPLPEPELRRRLFGRGVARAAVGGAPLLVGADRIREMLAERRTGHDRPH